MNNVNACLTSNYFSIGTNKSFLLKLRKWAFKTLISGLKISVFFSFFLVLKISAIYYSFWYIISSSVKVWSFINILLYRKTKLGEKCWSELISMIYLYSMLYSSLNINLWHISYSKIWDDCSWMPLNTKKSISLLPYYTNVSLIKCSCVLMIKWLNCRRLISKERYLISFSVFSPLEF